MGGIESEIENREKEGLPACLPRGFRSVRGEECSCLVHLVAYGWCGSRQVERMTKNGKQMGKEGERERLRKF